VGVAFLPVLPPRFFCVCRKALELIPGRNPPGISPRTSIMACPFCNFAAHLPAFLFA